PNEVTLIPLPFNDSHILVTHVTLIYPLLARAIQLRERINTLVYAYYLGMIFAGATSAQKRLLRELVTPHYYITALRIYDIFVVVGMAQIYRTAIVTYYDIQDLRVAE
ncbi:13450_t:CDS:1, partial [Racocetra persica]